MKYYELFITTELPKPLSKKELFEYFEKMKLGDTTAREEIINHNIRLVRNQVLKKFSNTPYDLKELFSVGMIGLIKSVDTFDISKNSQFSTYSTRCIDNEILMFMRKGEKYIHDASLDYTIGNDKKGNELHLEDVLADENSDFVSQYEDNETYKQIRKIVYKLPEREKNIIIKHFGFVDNDPMSQKAIARELGISQSYVSRIVKKVLQKINNELNSQEVINKSVSKDKEREVKKMARKLQSIYQVFNEYSREQIDEMLSRLTEDEKLLIMERYGSDLDNPIVSENWNEKKRNKFYGVLYPKMRKILENLDKKEIVKEDYNNTLEMVKNANFGQILNILTIKEAVIICLRFGFIDGKYFSDESIADFLKIDIKEVIEITKKALLKYKQSINEFVDKAFEYTTNNESSHTK